MPIGKAGSATTAISTSDAESLTVRGRDLCANLMGRAPHLALARAAEAALLAHPAEESAHPIGFLMAAAAEDANAYAPVEGS